ncbi:type IV toxin-antitoxin system AbiEi family antitoxin domain-containing protein [Amycolatopsis palatopharyngis]|uniref:type IV toxin-antitoxin system AbiEi family antitoxin domain-containing protein n=1 Tax=Amycolatopsis palatopharyngis TaxID=187982 RepID=UPI000E2459E7|nr:type IV toxin-antitoxin system AbiEi family antitoxin domain-containing protein [Amycolatopsis palatopharyngis]
MTGRGDVLARLPPTFTAHAAVEVGVSRSRLYRLKTEGAVLELSRGVYRKASAAETAHLDLLAVSLRVPRAVEIARIEIDDGVEFAVERIGSAVICEGDLYEGMRITMPAR